MRRPRNLPVTELLVRQVVVVILTVSLLLNSCTTHRAGTAVSQTEKEPSQQAGILSEERRALDKLKRTVAEQIASAQRNRLEGESKIRSTPPYFFKRFELYPTGASEPEFSLRETGYALKPYEVTVTVQKARFTTKYHTSRSACARDKQFIRDIGTQTDTYVYENGRWTLLYSVFEVENTSVRRGDTWENVTGKVERAATGENESVFGRVIGFFRAVF